MPVDVLIRPFLKELDFEKALADFLPPTWLGNLM
jgi:type I restriction enzyme R subunit